MTIKNLSDAVVGGMLKIDTSYTGKIIVSDGSEQIHVPFGKKITFITLQHIYEGVLEGVSDDGYDLILDGRQTAIDSPMCFFATLD